MVERILVALDDSDSSKKAVEYLASTVAGRDDVYVHLTHVLAPVPAVLSAKAVSAMRRLGTTEREVSVNRELLAGFAEQLHAAGLVGDHVDTGFISVPQGDSVVGALLDTARDQRCDTIVVGRNTLPWHREIFHHHLSDEIVKRASGFTLWVVE